MVTTRAKDYPDPYPYLIESEIKESNFIIKLFLIYFILILMLFTAIYYNYINEYITIIKDIFIIYFYYMIENLQYIYNILKHMFIKYYYL
jgi:hypothetical protein